MISNRPTASPQQQEAESPNNKNESKVLLKVSEILGSTAFIISGKLSILEIEGPMSPHLRDTDGNENLGLAFQIPATVINLIEYFRLS
ncbi:hypothetical protein E2542_SST15994 [Spatholobus suberectus]|nr:hypothetical protein E2542_SST15994 [Spatholobus suberectus]